MHFFFHLIEIKTAAVAKLRSNPNPTPHKKSIIPITLNLNICSEIA